MILLQLQQHLNASSVLRQDKDEMMRQGVALQQERQELAERMAKLERENDQRRRAEQTLRQEWGDARDSAEIAKNMIISEGRAAIHRAE